MRATAEGTTAIAAVGREPAREPAASRSVGSAATDRRLNAVLRPLAVASFVAVVARSLPGESAYDFSTLYNGATSFLHGHPVYVDSGYVLTPSGLLLSSPLGLLPRQTGRELLVLLTAACAIGAGLVVLRMLDRSWRSPVGAAVLLGLALSETVTFTMVLGNINTVLAVLVALALWGQTRGRDLPAGVALGLAVALKPIAGPLLLLPLIGRRWRCLAVAVALTTVTNIVGILLVAAPEQFLHVTLPDLTSVRPAFNVSAGYAGLYLGLPHLVVLAVRVAIAALALASVWWSQRVPDAALRLSVQAGALSLGVFLVSSLSETYWSIVVLPLLLTVVRPSSPMHSWVAWLGVYLFATQDVWPTQPLLPHVGQAFAQLHPTVGWLLLLLAVVSWSWHQRRPGEVHSGLAQPQVGALGPS